MLRKAKTGGFFFRTLPTVKTQAYASAKIAAERGFKRVAMIYINTDFGTGMVKDFTTAFSKLGGQVVKTVAYNENQPSYRAEVNTALAEKPDAVFFVAFPQDGATMTREWISLGGTQNLILNNSLRSPEYVKSVGARFLQNAFGMDNASVAGPMVEAFKQTFQAAYNASPDGPGIYTQYDAVMVLGLAMNIAPELTGTAIRDSIRKIQDPRRDRHRHRPRGVQESGRSHQGGQADPLFRRDRPGGIRCQRRRQRRRIDLDHQGR